MKKKFSFAVIFFIVGIILAVFISVSAVRESYRSRTIEKEVENLRQEAQRIQSENESIAERISYFETADFQERIAKEKLNLQKSDESVVVVKQRVGEQTQTASNQDIDVNSDQDEANYIKWWNFFFKY